ncbi:MAG: helix-turn-helix domain-containing protein [Clostridia bacterium]
MITKQAELKKQAYSSDLKSRALSILIYLIDRSNKELTCFPAIPTMAEQLHISQSTVKRALHELVDAGFIQKDSRFRENNRGQSSNLYTLVFKAEASAPVSEQDNNLTQEDYIEPAKQTAAANSNLSKTAEHITFADIAPKQEQTPPAPQEPAPKVSQPFEAMPSRAKQPSIFPPRTPVHSAHFHRVLERGQTGYHFLQGKVREMAAAPCRWTGAEVNLYPP